MVVRFSMIALLFLLLALPARAQLSLQLPFPATAKAAQAASPDMFSSNPIRKDFLPRHVRENPRGYSPLCRLELRIEDELPIGMWVKLGPNPHLNSAIQTNAEFRLKVFLF